MPKQIEKEKLLVDYMGIKMVDGQAMDPKFKQFLSTVDGHKFWEDSNPDMDKAHPTDPKRSSLKDLSKMFDRLTKEAKDRGEDGLDRRDINRNFYKLINEYGDGLGIDQKGEKRYAKDMAVINKFGDQVNEMKAEAQIQRDLDKSKPRVAKYEEFTEYWKNIQIDAARADPDRERGELRESQWNTIFHHPDGTEERVEGYVEK